MHTARSNSRRLLFTALVLLTLLTAPTLFLATSPAGAGVIDPAYERYVDTLPEDTQVSVLIYLSEQVPLAALDAELKAQNATRSSRHEQVITALQGTAAASQAPLLADLTARQAGGKVRGFTPYWIANLVVAQMMVRDVREVAGREDVGVIYENFTVSLIEPVETPTANQDPEQIAAATPGICAINVRRVWSELGITGTGRLIAGLDTGVQGTHLALASRWRGNDVGVLPQHAWRDALGSTTFPTDTHFQGHGTHTMGTMCGLGVAAQESVGVAFGAKWIACNAINQATGPEFDNDVIGAFQWLADPDENPETTADVPDVVQNSWGVIESISYPNCDTRWWAVIDGCEAAGCAVVFSAGNEGPAPFTLRSPADRITSPTNVFSIGAVDAQSCTFPHSIASFSSRGPSDCDGLTKKPEVVAPGVNVRSSINNGGYGPLSGTSMAGPHVSGICALMREANPDLDVTTMKQIIMDTARDLGTVGEDNAYGWGMVDAYAAVVAALETTGITANAPAAAGQLRLVTRPNPFNPASLVSYEVANRTRVALRVYDLQGRRVRTLADGMVDPGRHSTLFDGRNDAGHDLASGTYFLRIEAGSQRAVEKLSLVR